MTKKQKLRRIALVLGLALPCLVILLCLALYIPWVQDRAKSYIEDYATEALGMRLEVGQIRLGFPLDLRLSQVTVLQTEQDTLASLANLSLELSPSALLSGRILSPSVKLEGLTLNYRDSLELSQTAISLPYLEIQELSIQTTSESLYLSSLRGRGAKVRYYSIDTTASKASEPSRWKILADEILLEESELELMMPRDSLFVRSDFGQLRLLGGALELETTKLRLDEGILEDSHITYHKYEGQHPSLELDPNYIDVQQLNIGIKALRYDQSGKLSLEISKGEARERSGLEIKLLQGSYAMDSLGFELENLALQTEHSSLYGQAKIPWSIFRGDSTAHALIELDSSLGIPDLKSITGKNLIELAESTEGIKLRATSKLRTLQHPISLALTAQGTLQELRLTGLTVMWEDVFDLYTFGILHDLHNPKTLRGQLELEAGMQSKARSLLGLVSPELALRYNIPSGLILKAKARYQSGGEQDYHILLKDGDKEVVTQAHWNPLNQHYKADIKIAGINLLRYAPLESIGELRAELRLSGQGLDPLLKRTGVELSGRIESITYRDLQFKDISIDGRLKGGELGVALNSFNPGLNFSLLTDGLLSREGIRSNLMLEASDLNLSALGLSPTTLSGRLTLSGELQSDLKETHSFTAQAQQLRFTIGEETLSPEELKLNINTNSSQSRLSLLSGDLKLSVETQAGYLALLERTDKLSTMSERLLQELSDTLPMRLRLEDFVQEAPSLDLDLELGRRNALMELFLSHRLALEKLSGHLRLRPESGLEGSISLRDIRRDTLRIDCIDLDLSTERHPRSELASTATRGKEQAQDSLVLVLRGKVDKTPWRNQPPLQASALFKTSLSQAELNLAFDDASPRGKHHAKLRAEWSGSSYSLSLPEESILLSGKRLHINKDNYFALHKQSKTILAHLALEGNDGAMLRLDANHLDGSSGQEIILAVNRLELSDYQNLGLPDLSGRLSSDIRYSRSGDKASAAVITGDLAVQKLRYEGKELGHFATALFYEPRNDQSHYITAEISYNGHPALAIDGIYHSDHKTAPLSGSLSLRQFPLLMANPFLAQFSTALEGVLEGNLKLGGKLSAPQLNGSLSTHSASVQLKNIATTLHLDSVPLRLEGTHLYFDRFATYSTADSKDPILLDGSIDLLGGKGFYTDLQITAEETTLFDTPRPTDIDQLVYGKLITSSSLFLKGQASALKVRGSVHLLGGSNVTYRMLEDKLEQRDAMSGVLTFMDFADTLFTKKPVEELNLGGLDVRLNITIDPAVRFGVDLTANGQDNVHMQGGGQLQFSYPPFGQMRLVGKYEMSRGGTLSYTIPIVGNKTFSIAQTSYIEFDGEATNPYVNLSASQKVRALAGAGEGYTNFLVGIQIKDKIDRLRLGFDLSAPEHLSLQNSISMMTEEERSKQAIGLLATSTYLAAGSSSFDGALTGLLQNQLNAMAGSLLGQTDLSLGMEQGDTDGSMNYTYSFSRRFYNDRLRIIIGGKIQTGKNTSKRERSLIDNISLEYQMDKAGEYYLQLYRNLVTDNALEGEYTEMGIGFILRRRLARLSDLLHIGKSRKKQQESPKAQPFTLPAFALPSPADSLSTESQVKD